MADRPTLHVFGKRSAGDPPPDFALWLADRQAKTHAIAGRADLRAWVGGVLDDDRTAALIDAVDARSSAPDHSFVAVKADGAETAPPGDELWRLGRTQTMEGSHGVTVIVFATTHRFLLDP